MDNNLMDNNSTVWSFYREGSPSLVVGRGFVEKIWIEEDGSYHIEIAMCPNNFPIVLLHCGEEWREDANLSEIVHKNGQIHSTKPNTLLRKRDFVQFVAVGLQHHPEPEQRRGYLISLKRFDPNDYDRWFEGKDLLQILFNNN